MAVNVSVLPALADDDESDITGEIEAIVMAPASANPEPSETPI